MANGQTRAMSISVLVESFFMLSVRHDDVGDFLLLPLLLLSVVLFCSAWLLRDEPGDRKAATVEVVLFVRVGEVEGEVVDVVVGSIGPALPVLVLLCISFFITLLASVSYTFVSQSNRGLS